MNEPRVRNDNGDAICDECGTSIIDGDGWDYAGKRMCSGCVNMYETGVDRVDDRRRHA